MYIGILKTVGDPVFTYADSTIPLPPTAVEEDVYTWSWKTLYDSVLDITQTLETPAFVGALHITLPEQAISRAEVLIDGELACCHSAETDGLTGGELTLPVGKHGSKVTLRLHAELKDIILSAPVILGAQEDAAPLVWPAPHNAEFSDSTLPIAEITAATDDADEQFAAQFLRERLTERFGTWQTPGGVQILIAKDSTYTGERYTVSADGLLVTVKAATRLSLLYGTDTVLQLTSPAGLRLANVDDAPTHEMRGFHMGLPHRDHFDFVRRLFRYVLLPLRFNMLFVEFAGGMRFDRHPAISEAWLRATENFEKGLQPKMPHSGMGACGTVLEKGEVREFLDYARELGMEIIPEVQSLGHVQYITYAYPELAEIDAEEVLDEDARNEDMRPSKFYRHCYCPSLERSYEVIFDLIDEIVEVAQPPRYVHIGHDEVYQIGVCKRCRGKDPAELFAKHVIALHDYIAKKGLGTMMWSDMLHPAPVRPYLTSRAADLLPRDIVMLDFVWYFNLPLDIEDRLLTRGYKVGIGNLYSPNFPRYSKRLAKQGMLGGQLSVWLINEERIYGENGKFFDATYLSQMLWNAEAYDERNRAAYNHVIATTIQPRMRDELRGKHLPQGYRTSVIPLPAGNTQGIPADLRTLCPDVIDAEGVTIPVNASFARLVFEHTTLRPAPRIAWGEFIPVGTYTVTFEDGTAERVEIAYGRNVLRYDRAYAKPMPHKFYRHQALVGTWHADPAYVGKDARGGDLCVCGAVWENPHPEKKISHVSYTRDAKDTARLLLAGIKGQSPNE